MDHNCISDLKESMGQWTNLTHFNMAFNNISTMPNSCANWVNLEVCAATSLFLSLYLSFSQFLSESKPVSQCVSVSGSAATAQTAAWQFTWNAVRCCQVLLANTNSFIGIPVGVGMWKKVLFAL